MGTLPPLPAKKMPTLLTKAEALEYAASVLDDLAFGVELGAMILKSIPASNAASLSTELSDQLVRFREGIVDEKLQASAARQGAKTIRAMLLEERLVAARVEAGAGIGQ